ncbi:MAG: hypothetical protein ACP6IY_20360 [Promethearchaeia archaeon]
MKISENKQRKKFYLYLLYFKCFLPIILRHHPECSKFKGHTLNIGKYGLCIGCFVGYPTAILSAIIMGIINIEKYLSIEILFILSASFLGTYFLSPLNLTRWKKIKIAQKFCLGLGFAFLFWAITSLSTSFVNKIFLYFGIFGTIFFLLNVQHAYSFYKSCKKCETPFAWSKCNGFKSIRENFEKYEINNILNSFNQKAKNLMDERKFN